MRISRLAATAALAILASSCSMMPWNSGPKLPKLADIPNAVPVSKLWNVSLPNPGTEAPVPAVVGDSVFAAGGGGVLARYDLKTGKEVWRVKIGQIITGGVGSDGNIVVVGTGKGNVYAYDGNGKPVWNVQVSSEVLSPPAVAGGLVVVRTSDNRTFGLEAADGKRRWLVQRASPALVARSRAEAVISGSRIYEGFAGGKLVALNADTGALQWEGTVSVPRGATELERISDVTSAPVVMDGVACAIAFQGKLSCFDATSGNPMWSRDVSSTVSLGIDVRYVFATDERGVLYAFDRSTGASMWKTDKLSQRQLSAPVSQGRFVAVGDMLGIIHFLNREDGSFAGRIATDGSAISATMKVADRTLVVQTRKGNVYAVSAQ